MSFLERFLFCNEDGGEELLFESHPFQVGRQVFGVGIAFVEVVDIVQIVHIVEGGGVALIVVVFLHVVDVGVPEKLEFAAVLVDVIRQVDEAHGIVEAVVVGTEGVEEFQIAGGIEGVGRGRVAFLVGVDPQREALFVAVEHVEGVGGGGEVQVAGVDDGIVRQFEVEPHLGVAVVEQHQFFLGLIFGRITVDVGVFDAGDVAAGAGEVVLCQLRIHDVVTGLGVIGVTESTEVLRNGLGRGGGGGERVGGGAVGQSLCGHFHILLNLRLLFGKFLGFRLVRLLCFIGGVKAVAHQHSEDQQQPDNCVFIHLFKVEK